VDPAESRKGRTTNGTNNKDPLWGQSGGGHRRGKLTVVYRSEFFVQGKAEGYQTGDVVVFKTKR